MLVTIRRTSSSERSRFGGGGGSPAMAEPLHMNNIGLILRNVVIFLFPVPWLLSFAIEHGTDWTAWVAYIAIVVLVLAAVVSGWVASRRDR